MKNFFYGLSCRQTLQLEKLAAYCPFDGIEFPGEVLECRPIMNKLAKSGKTLVVRELCATSLAHALPEAGSGIYRDFNRLFYERVKLSATYGIKQVGINFDFHQALANPEYEKKLRKILLNCFGILDKFRITLLLNCRIPGTSAVSLLEFKHRLLYSGVELLLHFHPHEPEAVESLHAVMPSLFLYRSNWRITFYPEHGNYINHEVLNLIRKEAKPGASLWLSPGNRIHEDEYLSSLYNLCTQGVNP